MISGLTDSISFTSFVTSLTNRGNETAPESCVVSKLIERDAPSEGVSLQVSLCGDGNMGSNGCSSMLNRDKYNYVLYFITYL